MSAKQHTPRREDSVTDGFILRYLEGLDSPRSLAVYLLYKHGEHQQLLDLPVDTSCEPICRLRSADRARADYLATEFLSKADFLDLTIDKKQVAVQKFLDSETQCRASNRRLNLVRDVADLPHVERLNAARWKIHQVLGAFDPLEFIEKVNWGPGSTVSLTRAQRLAYDKFRLESGMNANSLRFWSQDLWDSAFPRWSPERVEQVAYLHTVPKNSKTDRCIMIEPGISTMLQLGLGKMLRSRLRRVGIDLRHQADVHRNIVPLAAKHGELATVDFSSASDTICMRLVEWLLPNDWFSVLCAHRSGDVRLPDGEIRHLEKFSSMGNGFTFELQTLIFWALATSVVRSGFVSVFGDDVVLPSASMDQYRELVTYCGLTLNTRKSFSSGYFRESCGAHSFNGIDAKPLYLRGRIRSVYDVFKTSNQVRRLASRCGTSSSCDGRFGRAWHYLVGAHVGRKFGLRFSDFYIPDGFGDCGVVVDFDVATPFIRRLRGGWEGYSCRVLSIRFECTRTVDDLPLLLSRLFELGNEWISGSETWDQSLDELALQNTVSHGNELPDLESRIIIARDGRLVVPCWRNLGPFV